MKTTLNPDCLRWARERANLSVAYLAKKLSVKEEAIAAWETTGEITLAQAERLATSAHVPYGQLFLPSPPAYALPIPDFRTVGSERVGDPSPELLDTINDALLRQDWYRDYLIENEAEPLSFVGSVTVNVDPASVAARMMSVLAWNQSLRLQSRTFEDAYNRRIATAEEAGILVMRNSVAGNNNHRPLSVEEFRGFALVDKYAPLIFVNSRDSKAAQIFTLAHEMVHIWLGSSGVSNENLAESGANDVERFCNAVAAELLVPASELRQQWQLFQNFRDIVDRLVKHFKVSSLVVIRRLYDLGLLNIETFRHMYESAIAQIGLRSKSDVGGGNFYYTVRSRLGIRFVSAIVSSTLEGRTPFRTAFRLIGVNSADQIHKLASYTMEAA